MWSNLLCLRQWKSLTGVEKRSDYDHRVFFYISVSKEAKKQDLKDELYRKIVQAGILPVDSNMGGEVVSEK